MDTFDPVAATMVSLLGYVYVSDEYICFFSEYIPHLQKKIKTSFSKIISIKRGEDCNTPDPSSIVIVACEFSCYIRSESQQAVCSNSLSSYYLS